MSGQNYFFPGPSDPSFYGFYNGNAKYERQFFGNASDSYLNPATGTNSVAKRRRQDNLRPLQAWKQVSLLRSLRFQVWKAVTAVETTTQMTAKEKRK